MSKISRPPDFTSNRNLLTVLDGGTNLWALNGSRARLRSRWDPFQVPFLNGVLWLSHWKKSWGPPLPALFLDVSNSGPMLGVADRE